MSDQSDLIAEIPASRPVLIAGPTASGKSALALEIAERQGGVVVNADASQVYDCWRILSARPDAAEEARAPHLLYGHVAAKAPYSAGHWLREVRAILESGARPIICGGTGLYFLALTEGLAEIPATPAEVRAAGDMLSLPELLAGLDAETAQAIDRANRARVQRAWEVLQATGRPLRQWQAETGPPVLPLSDCAALVFERDVTELNNRIARRVDLMLDEGVLEEVRAVQPHYDPALPAHRAIGAPELIDYLEGEISLNEARESTIISTRQFAKRQRTWMRKRMRTWRRISPGQS
ncbi:MAG: tRNA (adenosine(37)-N6)-dimethylallyltransferase MiaA [Sulfitobacter sp.]|nr:tRNA (adenosine(37)-N6)-dimethylallyltransferase MiaA [Sulfitobacter sp.]